MPLYSKTTLEVKISGAADYSNPHWTFSPPVYTPAALTDEGAFRFRFKADKTAAEAIITTTLFQSITLFAVKNLDPTNFITVVWRSAANSTTDNKARVAAGGLFVTTDVTATTSPTIQADTDDVICEVVIIGDTEA